MSFIQSNNQAEKVVSQLEYFTGLRKVQPVAVNPSLDELKAMGIQTDKEPVYLELKDNFQVFTLRFWLKYVDMKNQEKLANVSFRISDKEFTSGSGKKQYIDIAGNTSWSMDLNSISETSIKYGFKVDSARPAYVGEESLLKFLQAWFNVKPGDACRPDNYKQEFKGVFTGFKSLFKDPNSKNELFVLFTLSVVKGNVYNQVYSNYFSRASTNNIINWSKHISAQTKYLSESGKANSLYFGEDFTFKQVPDTIVASLVQAASTDTNESEGPKPTSVDEAGF